MIMVSLYVAVPRNKLTLSILGAHLHAIGDTIVRSLGAMSYNLIVTSNLILVVPRQSRQTTDGIEVNSVGFVGSFLVRNEAQAVAIRTAGPFNILKGVTFPI
jgi:ATP adenylyltransferase